MERSTIELGVDTLCYHLRLQSGDVSHEDVVREVAAAGFPWLQLNAKSGGVDGWEPGRCGALAEVAADAGVRLLYSGMDIGRAGDDRRDARARARRWLEQARAFGSPILRVYSRGFWHELPHTGPAREAELAYLADLLGELRRDAEELELQLALENHSNLPAAALEQLVVSVGSPAIRVHLDLTNYVSVLEDPLTTISLLGPHAVSGHVKDFAVESIPNPDGRHRRGFKVLWRYPGDGLADFGAMLPLLASSVAVGAFPLTIEGLDHEPSDNDQAERLVRARQHLSSFL